MWGWWKYNFRHEEIAHVVGVFFLDGENFDQHLLGSRVLVADRQDHLAIRLDRDTLGDQVGAHQGLGVFRIVVLGMRTGRQRGRIEVRRTVELDDALGDAVGVLLLLLGVLEELGLQGAVVRAADGVIVALVAQHAQQFGGERAVEHCDDGFAVGRIALGDGAVVDVGSGAADRLDVEAVAQGRNALFHDVSLNLLIKWY